MRSLLVPPAFASEDQTQRARIFHFVVWMTLLIASVFLIAVMVEQPAAAPRLAFALFFVNALGLVLLAVSRRGSTRLASILFVGGLVLLLTGMSLTAGGIHASGVTMYFVVALMAGLLLGERAGVATALTCAVLGLGLALAEEFGVLPPEAVQYSPMSLWLLNCLYMGVVIMLMRLATQAVTNALRRAESELSERRQVEQRLERALDAGAIGVWERDLRSSEFYGDDRTFALLGLPVSADKMIDFEKWKGMVHPDDLPKVLAIIDELAGGARNASAEYRLILPDGRWRYLEATASQITDEGGQSVRHVGTLIDVTGRKTVEQQRERLEGQLQQSQRMEALGTLAGGIAHDFNNLLAVIGSNAELGRADVPEGHPARTSLDEIAKASAQAKDIVRQILLFSRRQATERKPIQLLPAVEDALKLLRATLPPNVQIRPVLEPALPPVSAAASQICQVIMNLGSNAAHAMSPAGGVLTVSMDCIAVEGNAAAPSVELAPGRHVRITIQDSGTGMSPETLQHMFEPFFTTKGLAGTGLGLSVVHGIVRDHGGAISVESELGRGTTFRVYLPAVTPAAVESQPETLEPIRGSGEHVMYIDDEEDLVFVAERILERLGYRCSAYADADAAVQAFRANPDDFDAVVTDMMMPTMTGLEVAHALRAIRPDLPVAFTSGRWDKDIETAGFDGTATWIRKPATVEELSRALHGMLQRAH